AVDDSSPAARARNTVFFMSAPPFGRLLVRLFMPAPGLPALPSLSACRHNGRMSGNRPLGRIDDAAFRFDAPVGAEDDRAIFPIVYAQRSVFRLNHAQPRECRPERVERSVRIRLPEPHDPC